MHQCDRCGLIHDFDHGDFEFKHGIWRKIFFGRSFPECVDFDFCEICAKEDTTLIYRLRDIDETQLFNNKLERAIREKRRANNRATKNAFSERRKGCAERRLGNCESRGNSQVSEEHY